MLYIVFRFADLYAVILDLHGFSGKPDDPLDVRDGLAGRHEDDDVASLELAESRSDLVHDDEIVLLERRSHACAYDRVRIGDEESDEQHDASYENQERYHIKEIQEEISHFHFESHYQQNLRYKSIKEMTVKYRYFFVCIHKYRLVYVFIRAVYCI